MRGIDYLCKHYDADEDCARCMKRGILVGGCVAGCPDFEDVRDDMPDELLAERERLMKIMGVEDAIPYERRAND